MESPFEEFIHISTGPAPPDNTVTSEYYSNATGKRWSIETLMTASIRRNHPRHHLTITPSNPDLLAFANVHEDISYTIHGNPADAMISRQFLPPARRYNDEKGGVFNDQVQFGVYDYKFKGTKFLIYLANGSEGAMYMGKFAYILVDLGKEDIGEQDMAVAEGKANSLIKAAAVWSQELHDEVLIFDRGFWQKNKELWQNVQKAEWEDVILEKERKEAIIEDVIGFFDAQKKYEEFGVPWKRGVIFYGPPGNGKTISTKALMHDVMKRKNPSVVCLYVKTFTAFGGPEAGIRLIFQKARQMAPCILIFEDIDSLVGDSVRSYFLNEVDGLESNHGILMVGSTNHLERLDPGIAKRPSRFDRKYLFDIPSRDERIQYCEYWRNKLRKNRTIDFPKELSAKVADITGDFSFAYMKEAFVAALLVLARSTGDEMLKRKRWEDPLSGNLLWKEIQKQVDTLRKEIEEDSDETSNLNMMSGMWPALSTMLDEPGSSTRPMDIQRPKDIQNIAPRYM